MRKPVGDVAPNADYFANVKFESRLDAAIIPPIQKKRLTQRYRVASWSGEVCPGTCEAGMPNTSLQGRTRGGPWTDLPGSRRGLCKNFRCTDLPAETSVRPKFRKFRVQLPFT